MPDCRIVRACNPVVHIRIDDAFITQHGILAQRLDTSCRFLDKKSPQLHRVASSVDVNLEPVLRPVLFYSCSDDGNDVRPVPTRSDVGDSNEALDLSE